ncbi:MAG TPA: hypothetical protein VMB79_16915, partial [Jatrophihabitans sp.]|nr:hypothetical protein [Jatrophihabitans sp.]
MDQDEDMHNATRPALDSAPDAGRRPGRGRRRTALLSIVATLLALVVPAAIAPIHAAAISPIGSLDSATVLTDGNVAMYGWAADTDAPTAPVRVEFRDGGSYVAAVVATAARADVAAAYPQLGPSHGYLKELTLADGAHQLCAWVTFASGQQSQLGCQSVTVANNPQGTAGTATVVDNTATITGTATDANTTNPVVVRGYVDGHYAAGAQTDAQHRYSLAVPVAEGSHTVCVYAINSGAGANSTLGCQTVVVRNNPFGALDSVAQLPLGVRADGWAIDLNATGPVLVRAYVDGKHAADLWASGSRPDLVSHYPTAGPNHGYSFTLPVTGGTHRICTYVSNVGPGTSQLLGCDTVSVVDSPVGQVEKSVQVPGGV